MANALKNLQKENNRLEKQLTTDNDLILTDIVVYLRSSNLKDYDIEVIRKELIGMALESQLRGSSLKDTVGEDYKEFCDELIKNGREKTVYEKSLDYLTIFSAGVGFLYLLEVVFTSTIANIFTKADFTMPITLGFLISTAFNVIFALAIYWYISNKSFELSGKNRRKYQVVFILVFTVIFSSGVLFKIFFKDVVLFSINSLYPFLFFIIALVINKILTDRNIDSIAKTETGIFK